MGLDILEQGIALEEDVAIVVCMYFDTALLIWPMAVSRISGVCPGRPDNLQMDRKIPLAPKPFGQSPWGDRYPV